MKIRVKKTGDVIDVESVVFYNKDKNHPNYVVEPLLLDDPIIKAINETFEDAHPIVLPRKIRKALQAWIDAQTCKEVPNNKIFFKDKKTLGVEFSFYHNIYGHIKIGFDEAANLEDGKDYTLEELGLEAKK